jgi:hypothetical protein
MISVVRAAEVYRAVTSNNCSGDCNVGRPPDINTSQPVVHVLCMFSYLIQSPCGKVLFVKSVFAKLVKIPLLRNQSKYKVLMPSKIISN